ncbi:DinB family protein [Isoptericola sp. NEAU-Y5]|uniref:DinB family protein n=1 Tax=Isoptericola luteus TaxID=2879484 RepID=A0ABS7ZB66_9MICO|nr:DinB family protein [Isoptericola sp. NEAU-Y5]MCA5892153.1 DinB family protein [Isoptericola sp. NEAU-Y5]
MTDSQNRTAPDMWVDPEDDPRTQWADPVGELETHWSYLRSYRATIEMKCVDLDAEQLARRSVPPSTLSLLGLVRHLAKVEHTWFRRVLQSRTDLPRLYSTAEDPDADFDGAVADPAVVEEAWTAWRREVEAADAWLATQTDADMATVVLHHGRPMIVRDVLEHMVEEYARHAGHADLLRECIDGRTGQ